ncbi:hypothetical protein ACHAWU_001058 [Discostella pseudostelligera]|uniref:UBC core domain-containing protein n=1 Tax=Discostella pseudostelligera TaxID=259834 RepID=A0ABD3MJC3_9STRA
MNRPPITPSPKRPTPGKIRHTSTGQPTPSTVERDQAMKDYKLTVEYKNLKTSCPGGVYLLPSHDDNRFFHGVIFIRRGAFCNGIFKFTLRCPTTYNDYGTHPQVTFSSYVYNPHVHPETGELDIPVAFPEWNPNKHFLPTVVTYLKRIFYVKDYKDMSDEEQAKIPNQEALHLFQTDPESYRRRVQGCVEESQRSVYLTEPGCTINFTKEERSHELLRNMLKERFGESDGDGGGDNNTSNNDGESKAEDSSSAVVSREAVLDIIQQVAEQSLEGSF